MIIRLATYEDIPQILELGETFFNSTLIAKAGAPFDKDGTKELFEDLEEQELIVVAEIDGKIIGFILLDLNPTIGSFEIIQGSELAFYVEPGHREKGVGRELILGAEEVLRQHGAQVYSMSSMVTSNPKIVDKLYQDLNFIHTESTYSKVL